MATHPVKVGAEIQIACYSEGGIEEIKKALRAGVEAGKEDDVKIQLVSSPSYSIWLTTIDDKRGRSVIQNVIGVVRENIIASKGTLIVTKDPGLIGKNENKAFNENELEEDV